MADGSEDRLTDLFKLALRSDAPAAPTVWTATEGLTRETLLAAVDKVRNATYQPSCGGPGNPHIVHPHDGPRLMSWAAWDALGPAKWDVPFTRCGNCGSALPLNPVEPV